MQIAMLNNSNYISMEFLEDVHFEERSANDRFWPVVALRYLELKEHFGANWQEEKQKQYEEGGACYSNGFNLLTFLKT